MGATDWDADAEEERSQVRTVLDQYRALLYTFAAAALMAALGAIIDVAYGPMTGDNQLAHQIAGLLGAAALTFGFCLLLVGVLWVALIATNR